jgi:hypothetical protein
MPARIATGVYLVGQEHTTSNNLTYLVGVCAATAAARSNAGARLHFIAVLLAGSVNPALRL